MVRYSYNRGMLFSRNAIVTKSIATLINGIYLQLTCFQTTEDRLDKRSHEIQQAKVYARPCAIYVSAKADEDLVASLWTPLEPTASICDEFQVRSERSNLFSLPVALRQFESIRVGGMPADLGTRERLHYINTLISFSSEHQTIAAGALLAVLNAEHLLPPPIRGEQDIAPGLIPLRSINEASIDGFLMLDPTSMEALQIFSQERHPSAMGIGSNTKEGYSVFGVLDRCTSQAGKRLLCAWFQRPIVDLKVISDRFDSIDFFNCHHNEAKTVQALLRCVKDVDRLLLRLQTAPGIPDVKDISSFLDSIAAMIQVRQTLLQMISQDESMSMAEMIKHANTPLPSIFTKIASQVSSELVACRALISEVVDTDSLSEDGMMVAHGVHDELDELKHLYAGLPDFLTEVVQSDLQRIPPYLASALPAEQQWSIVYMPQVGFVLRVSGSRLYPAVLKEFPDFQFLFEGFEALDGVRLPDESAEPPTTGCTFGAYYMTATTCHLNERFGDLLHRIKDMESGIIKQLMLEVQKRYGHAIGASITATAELDCLLSLADAAHELKLTRPKLAQNTDLVIKNGRHLLTQGLVKTCIPNSTDLTAPSKIHIITGPNASGKSCYVKQVAVIAFLSHIGSFVPADEAVVGIVDRIFTRITSKEATAIPQSTFMIDLSQMANALKCSTEKSLIIVDEFGKGTLSADGIGLLCGMLHSLSKRPKPPRMLLATHFSEVANPALLPPSPCISFHTMEVIVPAEEQSTEAQNVMFLYKLAPGTVVSSFGIHCAKLGGVDENVLHRAQQLLALAKENRAVRPLRSNAMQGRAGAFAALAGRLSTLDTHNAVSCKALLSDVLGTLHTMY